MKNYICPECGKEIKDKFWVSIGGIFLSTTESINPYTVYAFLHDKVVLNEKVMDCPEFSIISNFITTWNDVLNEDDDEVVDLRKRIIEQSPECEKYYEILDSADISYIQPVLGYEMDIECDAAGVNCNQYVWATIVVKKIRDALLNYNRIVRYMLSAELDENVNLEKSNWCCVNLVECFTMHKLKNILESLTFLYDPVKLKADNEEAQVIIRMIQTADTCILKLHDDWCHPTIEEGEDGKHYLVNFQYGKNRGYIRICPECGAHIVSRLGIYDQKIISFIGMPSSGKSTLINSIYAALNRGGKGIFGINCKFDMNDPMYDEYEASYNNAQLNYLSTQKTLMGEHPSLSLYLEHNGKKGIYSFVDVPGEYFTATDIDKARNEVDMFHLNVMSHSDVLCLVVAGEQILPVKNMQLGDQRLAVFDPETLNYFINRIYNFKNIVLEGKCDIPVFFTITKPDEIKPDENAYDEVNGRIVWAESRIGNESEKHEVCQEQINTLYDILKSYQVIINETDIIDMNTLCELQDLSHRFILGASSSREFILKLFNALIGTTEIENVPMFMVSPFGFYASHDIWQISEEEKRYAIDNRVQFKNYPKDKLDLLIHALPEELTDKLPEEYSNNELQNIQKDMNITKSDLESILLNSYRERHKNDRPFGLEALLSWIFAFTGLMDFGFKKEHADREWYRNFFSNNRGALCRYKKKEEWELFVKNTIKRQDLMRKITESDSDIKSKSNELASCKAELDSMSFFKRIIYGGTLKRTINKCESDIATYTEQRNAWQVELDSIKVGI